jgi:hypothetical protein
VAAAVGAIAEALVITIAVLGGLALAAGAAFALHRLRHGQPRALPPREYGTTSVHPVQGRPQPRALPARPEVHLHFHGLGAEAVAEILRRAQDGLPPAS